MNINEMTVQMESNESTFFNNLEGERFSLEGIYEGVCNGGGIIPDFDTAKVQMLPESPNHLGIDELIENGMQWGADEFVKTEAWDRNSIILHYQPLIEFVANRISRRLPSYFEKNDLIGAGVVGLIDAIEKFDPTRDVRFKTYAEIRIRGAMLDELRSWDWMPRSMRENANQIKKVASTLERDLGRAADDGEMAKALGIEMDEFQRRSCRAAATSMLSLDMKIDNSVDGKERVTLLEKLSGLEEDEPQAKHAITELKQILGEGVNALPDQEWLVLFLYYYEEMTMKEIGQVMEVSESRVSQIHSNAASRLRKNVKERLVDY